MSPEDRQLLRDIDKRLQRLERVEDIAFIRNITRRCFDNIQLSDLPPISLGDLSNVTTTGATNGQVIKLNTTSGLWEPENDLDT